MADPEDGWPEIREGTAHTVLILGGTGEARALAARLTARGDRRVISSLAGRTGTPTYPPGEVRRGGFGGSRGLADYLRREAVACVIDATHPHAARISANAEAACAEAGVPLRRLTRTPWQPRPGDRWIAVPDYSTAAQRVPAGCRRPLLTVGRSNLAAFAGRTDVTWVVRVFEPPASSLPLAAYELVVARGPFSLESERALFDQYAVDGLVTKNSGGAEPAKLTVARERGLPVVVVESTDS